MKAYMVALTGSTNNLSFVLVARRSKKSQYTIPKGSVDKGELAIDAAVREAYEESGFRAWMPVPLGEKRKRNVYISYGTLVDDYLEAGIRERLIVPLHEVYSVPLPRWQKSLLQRIAAKMRKRNG